MLTIPVNLPSSQSKFIKSAKLLGEVSGRKAVWTECKGQPFPAVYKCRREFRPVDVSTGNNKVGVLTFLIIEITEKSASPFASSEIVLGWKNPGGGRQEAKGDCGNLLCIDVNLSP